MGFFNLVKSSNLNCYSAIKCSEILLNLNGIQYRANLGLNSKLALNDEFKVIKKKHRVSICFKYLNVKKVTNEMLPLAFKTKDGTFSILAQMSEQQALIQKVSSATPDVISVAELEKNWANEVILLKQASMKFDISWFIPEFSRYRKLIAEVLVFSLMLQFLALITPLFFQVVMDKVLVHRALSTLDVLVIVLIVVGIFDVILRGLREYLFAHTANRIDIRLGIKLFRHLLGLPLLYFKSRQVGAIVTRVQELDSIRDFLTGSLLTLSVDVLFTFVFFAVMAWLSTDLTLVVLAVLPFYLLLAWGTTKPLQKRIEDQFQTSAANMSFLNESVSGAETIKSLAVEPRMQRNWEQQTNDMVTAGFKTQTLNSFVNHGVMLLQKVSGVLIIWIGAHKVMSLELTIGQLIAFNMMASHVNQPVVKLIELWQQFVQTRVAIDKLGDMLDLPVEQKQGDESPATSLRGELRLNNISFRYQPDLPMVLNNIDLHIKPGETIGIVGPSGSGKSTLTKLLQKLYTQDEGEILVDDLSITDISPCYLRSQIGVVLQENYLFNTTVRENIAIRDVAVPLEDVVKAAKLAGAHDFILQLPLGYDTVIAEGGSSLSGGQRQRLAIARALIADPRILIFDEATSALDDESQAIIQSNMANIAKGRTVISIAHRLSTVRDCDRIITLEKGEITEMGSHSELLSLQGCYARLWNLQQELAEEKV